MMQELETALAPPHCHASIVANVVASRHAPPELRAAAIRHYCEHSDTPSVGALVSDRLRDARRCAGLAALADVLANALAITTSTGSGTVDVDAAMAQHHIHALGPPIVEAVAGSPHSAQLVRKLLAAPTMRDGVLTAAVLSPGVRAVAEPELVTMLESDVEPLLALDLDGHTAAALCSHSPAVSRAYTECLARATSHCQQRSLRVAAGDWELQLAQIAERWLLLAAKQPDVVAAALAPCRALLAPTVARCRPPATSHLFDATVGFWRALYAQFLDCPAADPSRTL
ncbi:hypothetical protein H4R19_000879 [Coemansia spiralis]|nr:hypothetical protein H4R19_000879 [Coemansia spiralis]